MLRHLNSRVCPARPAVVSVVIIQRIPSLLFVKGAEIWPVNGSCSLAGSLLTGLKAAIMLIVLEM